MNPSAVSHSPEGGATGGEPDRGIHVLLLKPPIRACMVEIGRHMPIGLAYLASTLRRGGIDVEIFDSLAWVEDNHVVPPECYSDTDRTKLAAHPRWRQIVHWGASWERIAATLRARRYDVVGISCMFTPYYEPAYEAARLVRQLQPEARIVLGGQHPTVAYEHALAEDAFDVFVLGEAEGTTADLVHTLVAGGDLREVPGVVFRCNRGLCRCRTPSEEVHVVPRAGWSDLDSLPLPAVDLVDMARYDDSATLITSRGCPFACSFCTVHAMVGKKFRTRSPNNVVDEIAHYVSVHGIRSFSIEDDNFTFDIPRVRAICAEVRSRNLDVELSLPNGMTVVDLTDDLAGEMAAAGFRSLFLGLETTDLIQLRRIRKGFTSLDKVRAGASWFRDRGVSASASLIVGLLGQDCRHVARDSINLMLAGIPFWTNPFYPIPGSPDFSRCQAAGLITLETDYALYDQFNFAIGSDELNPVEHYWAWVMTQALAQWPTFVLESAAARAGGPSDGRAGPMCLAAALERLIRHSAPLADATRSLEVPAVPVATDGRTVEVAAHGCFHSMHHLDRSATPDDFCIFTGDVIAGAASLATERPWAAVPVPAVDGRCRFQLVDDTDPVFDGVLRIFVDELADGVREWSATDGGDHRSPRRLVVVAEH